ncbi:cell wall-binding repeat-containing protein [Lihuaxuella thermophila]|uniref:Putative cell wall-binding protein n=1 Tax=Lihuaxuella thermophila TaxID=1173111 RepID=A0A1H8B5K5_9BACL|nr:cell wall-binding repeat-containing protein [Lihuaxuella thermophila]SEM78066.1 Putative cell wall-binding protein [Lihuaxuella thermophila]
MDHHQAKGRKALVLGVLAAVSLTTICSTKEATTLESGPGLKRLAGATRYETSVNISKELNALGLVSDTVVIARGDLYADALFGGPLAAKSKSPILLTPTASLREETKAEIQRRKPSRAVILGGTGAVSATVESQLKSLGVATVERIAGADRYAGSALTSEKVVAGGTADTAIIASGLNFPDALSASSVAAQKGWPILLVKTDLIPSPIQQFIARHREIKNFIIIGGPAVVSDQVKTQLQSYGTVTRIGGANRYEVSVHVAKHFKLPVDSLIFANGQDFPDALSGGPLAGCTGSPIILTKPAVLPPEASSYLREIKETKGEFYKGYILGGTGSVSAEVERMISSFTTYPPKKELRAFWVDMFRNGAKTPAQVDQLLLDVKKAKANAIFLQVRRRGDAFYNNSLEPRTEDPDMIRCKISFRKPMLPTRASRYMPGLP